MQLLLLIAVMMLTGKNQNLKELKPIIEELGSEEDVKAFKQAEELSQMLSAVQNITASAPTPTPQEKEACAPVSGYPLAPIASVADEKVTYCLARYIALGE